MEVVTPTKQQLRDLGTGAGLIAMGFTTADPFVGTIQDLEDRKQAGLHADMAFTYRNPARSGDITATFRWARTIIVGAWPYPAVSEHQSGSEAPGAIAAYVWEPHYDALRAALGAIASELASFGHTARVIADDNALVDRAAAVRAGVGWWGKNTNVLIPGFGSWFVLGSVVTDAEFAPDPILDASCGGCRRCLDSCPTGAIIEPGILDARRCLAWLVQSSQEFPIELRPALGGRVYGCDDCQTVCPPNRRPQRAGDEVAVVADLDLILDGTDEEVLARYGSWYIPKREVRFVRRNALMAWANTVSLDDPIIDARLERHLGADDPMLVAYAIWAARRLGREELLEVVDWKRAHDDEPYWRDRLSRERDDHLEVRIKEPVR